MDNSFDIIMIFLMLGVGIYFLRMGITGKGKHISLEDVKPGMEQAYLRRLRITSIALGIIAVTTAGIGALVRFMNMQQLRTIWMILAAILVFGGLINNILLSKFTIDKP